MSLELDRSGWKRVVFGDVVANINDYFDPRRDGVLPYVAGPHIDPGEVTVVGYGLTSDDDFPPTFKRRFQVGDVLLHSRGIEKLASVDRAGVTGEKLFVLRSKDENTILQRFLVWLLQSPRAQHHMRENFTGSVNKFLNWKPMAAMELDVPPRDDQKRIADLLWAVERHVRALVILQGAVEPDEAVDGVGRLLIDSRAAEWPTVRFTDAIKVSSGSFLPAKNMVQGEIPVYGGNGVAGHHDQANFPACVVMIGRVGAYCGAVHQTNGPSWVTDNALVIKRADGYKEAFLAAVLSLDPPASIVRWCC